MVEIANDLSPSKFSREQFTNGLRNIDRRFSYNSRMSSDKRIVFGTGSSKVWASLSYRNEGNSTMVLSVDGTRNVIRIKKLKPNDNGKCTHKNYELEFFEKVISKVIRVEFRPEFRPLFCSIADLQTVLGPFAVAVPLCFDCVSLMPDYGQLQSVVGRTFATYSIELKPKQGWVPKIDRFANKCIFCRMQTMKIRKGNVTSKTDYCPLDLFSGDRNRMFAAVDAILRCPQNNFRISVPLRAVLDDLFPSDQHGSYDSQYNRFCWFLVRLLADDLHANTVHIAKIPYQKPGSLRHGRESCRYFYRTKLRPRSILNEIFKNQQLISKWANWPNSRPASSDNDYAYVHNICAPQHYQHHHHHHQQQQQYLETIDEHDAIDRFVSESNDHFNFDNYLIGSVFNDCSILITFRKLMEFEQIDEQPKPDQFLVRFAEDGERTRLIVQMKIIDLGPKPITCIDHHRKRFENFKNYHLQYFT